MLAFQLAAKTEVGLVCVIETSPWDNPASGRGSVPVYVCCWNGDRLSTVLIYLISCCLKLLAICRDKKFNKYIEQVGLKFDASIMHTDYLFENAYDL